MFISLFLQIIVNLDSAMWMVEGYDFAFLDKDTIVVVNKKSIDTYSISKQKRLTSRPFNEYGGVLGLSKDNCFLFLIFDGAVIKVDLQDEKKRPQSLYLKNYWGSNYFYLPTTNQLAHFSASKVTFYDCETFKAVTTIRLDYGFGSNAQALNCFVEKDKIHLYIDPFSNLKSVSRLILDPKESEIKSTLWDKDAKSRTNDVVVHPKNPDIFWSITDEKLFLTTTEEKKEIKKELSKKARIAIDDKANTLLVTNMQNIHVFSLNEKLNHTHALTWKLDPKFDSGCCNLSPNGSYFGVRGTLNKKSIVVIGSLKK